MQQVLTKYLYLVSKGTLETINSHALKMKCMHSNDAMLQNAFSDYILDVKFTFLAPSVNFFLELEINFLLNKMTNDVE